MNSEPVFLSEKNALLTNGLTNKLTTMIIQVPRGRVTNKFFYKKPCYRFSAKTLFVFFQTNHHLYDALKTSQQIFYI
jgi:hypothetical protein